MNFYGNSMTFSSRNFLLAAPPAGRTFYGTGNKDVQFFWHPPPMANAWTGF